MSDGAASGCAGLCCAAFRIPYTRRELRRAVGRGSVTDGEKLLDMLVPLTSKQANERNRRFGGTGDVFREEEIGRHYTCVHWDEETRLCTDYEGRPGMCRHFPYGKRCCFGCSCSDE